jgi:hypothetical protein
VDRAGGGNRAARMGYCTITNGWSKRRAVAGVTGILERGIKRGRHGKRKRVRKGEREKKRVLQNEREKEIAQSKRL